MVGLGVGGLGFFLESCNFLVCRLYFEMFLEVVILLFLCCGMLTGWMEEGIVFSWFVYDFVVCGLVIVDFSGVFVLIDGVFCFFSIFVESRRNIL